MIWKFVLNFIRTLKFLTNHWIMRFFRNLYLFESNIIQNVENGAQKNQKTGSVTWLIRWNDVMYQSRTESIRSSCESQSSIRINISGCEQTQSAYSSSRDLFSRRNAGILTLDRSVPIFNSGSKRSIWFLCSSNVCEFSLAAACCSLLTGSSVSVSSESVVVSLLPFVGWR